MRPAIPDAAQDALPQDGLAADSLATGSIFALLFPESVFCCKALGFPFLLGLFTASFFIPEIQGIEILKVSVYIVFQEFTKFVNLAVFVCKDKVAGGVLAKRALVDEGHVA